ncbi:RHS repeat-associated core domain-containing protein [Catellatospora tritici]|uniref:RHS repeat-associated core domain-containing protein n=1 Tax=Catellatospora tritici TaxID=2851566 RepID=UPI0020C4E4C5|nr:RHS repeat-associated core domain-containing protein [Catellatospora tritici]
MTALATIMAMGVPNVAAAAPGGRITAGAPAVSPGPSVKGVHPVPSKFQPPANDPARRTFVADKTSFPAAADTTIALPTTTSAGLSATGSRVQGRGTPVWAQPVTGKRPVSLGVRVLDRARTEAAGVNGVLLTVTPDSSGTDPVRIGLDYAGFAQAYGGNYGSRLRFFQLPACALTTPTLAACQRRTPLVSSNDARTQSVSTQLAAAPASARTMVLAAASDPGNDGGSGGTFAATDLKPSGSWTGGGSTGSFGYDYPLVVPPAASKLVPKLALSYNSAGIDGQTASTQSQASWVGDGWSTPRSYVEQTFTACSESPEGTASPKSTPDMCYNGPILTLALNGSTTSLVWDSGASKWRPQQENGVTVTRVTGSNNGSGTYNTDYWKVVERDGTEYQFGRNQLPGWTSGKTPTNSVDSEPVYSSHSGDPCYQISGSGFNNSVCTMAYRWNLDYVTDVHGNAMAYYYKQDRNYYGQNQGASNTSYVRDSHLDRIDYGFADGGAYGTVGNRVQFNTGDRCVSGTCQPLNSANKANWPDVPYDLICASGATCSSWGPSFFSTVRLTSIATQQWSTATSSYIPVDTYALSQTIPPTGDGTSPTLWLSSITRTGNDTTAGGSASPIAMPPIQFGSIQLQNRVDTVTDGLPAFYRYRIQSVTTESGSVVTVTYGRPNPCTAPVTIAPASNTSSCYPVSWTPPGYTNPITDWFNKWAVTKVVSTDPTGGAPALSTTYRYLGGAAWHYDDNEVTKAKYRTYGQFRGYAKVQTVSGDGVNDLQTLTEASYYRGMSKNNNTTTVNVTDSLSGSHEDIDQLAGKPLETTTFRGDGGAVDHATITSYWVSGATATRTRTGLSALTANWVAEAKTYTRQAVTAGGTTNWQYTAVESSYDATVTSPTVGLLKHSYTHTLPVNTAYDQCLTNSYAPPSSTRNLVGLVAEAETVSVACAGYSAGTTDSVPGTLNALSAPTTVSRPNQVMSATRAFYDDPSFGTTFPQSAATITKGGTSMVRKATGYSGGAYTYQTDRRAVVDSWGRAVTGYDANNYLTNTSYTTNSAGLTTASVVTDPLGHTTTTTFDTLRGLPLTKTDVNGVVTRWQYDALGRTTGIWQYSRPTTAPANYKFSYVLSNTGLSSSTTERLNDSSGYQKSTLIYDALLRSRQTQTMTPQGGRLVTDTFYDSRGWVTSTYNGWWDPATLPNTTLVSAASLGSQVPSQTFTTYDGLGQAVKVTKAKNGVAVSTTTTVYNGDRTTVIPPAGGAVQTTINDPLGRAKQIDNFKVAPTVNTPTDTFKGLYSISGGTAISSTYGYDGHGRQSVLTIGSNTWTTTFNALGQVISKSDPDAGTSTNFIYDSNGNLKQSTDGGGKTVSYTFDALNRKTGMYASAYTAQSASNQLAKWVYDNSDNATPGMTYPIGHVTTATSYVGGQAYVQSAVNFNIFGKSLGEKTTLPTTEGTTLGTSWTVSHLYTATTGLPLKDIYPAQGGLPAETVLHGYSGVLDLPNTLGGLTGYTQGVSYDAFGRVNQVTLGSAPNQAYVTNTYDENNGNLLNQLVTRSTGTVTTLDEQAYRYDLAGNLNRQISTRMGSAATSETQCYSFDKLRRLVDAWTANDQCAIAPTPASRGMVADALGASSAYWTHWNISDDGNRTSQVEYSTTGGSDRTVNFTYNGNGTGQPNTLTGTTGAASGSTSFTYDAAGNMLTRNAGQGSQVLGWNEAGRLTGITGGTGGPSSFVYDADGNLMLQKNPGKTTFSVAGEQIDLNTSTGVATGTRYYSLPGGPTVVRTGSASAFSYAIADQHGTPVLYLDNTAQVPSWRQYTPFGAERGAAMTAPDNHGFLNKPVNSNTGLTHIGAREYDPVTGRFVSIDPLFDSQAPQTWNGYAYADNSPVNKSDPEGTCVVDEDTSRCYNPAAEKREEERKAQNKIDNDVHAKCDQACTLRRQAADRRAREYRASLIEWTKACSAMYVLICIDYPVHPKEEEEVVETSESIDLGPLSDIRISRTWGGDNAGTFSASNAITDAHTWSKALATKGSVSWDVAKTVKLGAEETFTYTWGDTHSDTHTDTQTAGYGAGERGYFAPDVSISWSKVNYYVRLSNGERVQTGTGYRLNVEYKGEYQVRVPAGATIPSGNSPQDVAAAIFNRLG